MCRKCWQIVVILCWFNNEENQQNIQHNETDDYIGPVPAVRTAHDGIYQKRKDALRGRNISDVFQVSNKQAYYLEPQANSKKIRLGVVGFGIRVKQ